MLQATDEAIQTSLKDKANKNLINANIQTNKIPLNPEIKTINEIKTQEKKQTISDEDKRDIESKIKYNGREQNFENPLYYFRNGHEGPKSKLSSRKHSE